MKTLEHADRPYSVTRHGQERMSQRAIRPRQVALISSFGVDHQQKGVGTLSFIPDDLISELREALDRCRGVALIKGVGEQVVTAFHQTRRVRHSGWRA